MSAILVQKKIRGLNTAWWRSGLDSPGAPVAILFHGFPDSPQTWDGQLEYLEKSFLVVRPLARGAAESEATENISRYRRGSVLLDSLEILTEVDPEKSRSVFIFGHDLGAVSAWELAAALGPRAKALVLVAGMGLDMFWNRRLRPSQHLKSWYMYLMQVPGLAETAFHWFGSEIVQTAYQQGGIKKENAWENLQAFVPGMIAHYRAGARDVLETPSEARRLNCPVLVLWGAHDPYLASVSQREWEKAAQNVEIRVLDAGHWPHQERRDTANRFITKFLEKSA